MPSRYLTVNGSPTSADDPKRLVWYSAGCTFWTDDWEQLRLSLGIPVCPDCGCPGYQIDAAKWFESARTYTEIPNYLTLLLANRHRCHGRDISLMDVHLQESN